jgi:hypothetical protein
LKVVVPYVEGKLDPRTTRALRLANIDARELDPADDCAYHALLSELWAAGETFAIVEHDIEIGPDTLTSFDKCPEPWCVAPYPGRSFKNYPVPILRVALGCVRFRAEFLKTNAGILDAMLPGPSNSLRNPRHWRRCDSLLASALQRRGFAAHEHEQVNHWHNYAADPPSSGWL